MKLSHPFIQLPLAYDAKVLAAEVAALGESPWRPHPQGFAGNSMLPLLAVDGDPANESFSGPMRATAELQACRYLMQVLASLGATLGRTRLMRLAGQAEVTQHVDQGYYWTERVRVHVPVVTQPTVRFECGDATINMAEGECWIFDTWRLHRVFNDADASRIHLVADTVGGSEFWDLVARGRPGGVVGGPVWTPRHVAASTGTPRLVTESLNIPDVMTPWEMESHFRLLFSDLRPDPHVVALQRESMHLVRTWRGLWFRHGTATHGRDEYRRALEHYVRSVGPIGQEALLGNGIGWFSAMISIIAKFAVSPARPAAVVPNDYG